MNRLLFLTVVAATIAGSTGKLFEANDFLEFLGETETAIQEMTQRVLAILPVDSDLANEMLITMKAEAKTITDTLKAELAKQYEPLMNNPLLASKAESLQERIDCTIERVTDEMARLENAIKDDETIKDHFESELIAFIDQSRKQYRAIEDLIKEQDLNDEFKEFLSIKKKAFRDLKKQIGQLILAVGDKTKEVLDEMYNQASNIYKNLKQGIDNIYTKVTSNPELAEKVQQLHEETLATVDKLMTEIRKLESELDEKDTIKRNFESTLKELFDKSKNQFYELEVMMAEEAMSKEFKEFMNETKEKFSDVDKSIDNMIDTSRDQSNELLEVLRTHAEETAVIIMNEILKIREMVKDQPELTELVIAMKVTMNETLWVLRTDNKSGPEIYHNEYSLAIDVTIGELKKFESVTITKGLATGELQAALIELANNLIDDYVKLESEVKDLTIPKDFNAFLFTSQNEFENITGCIEGLLKNLMDVIRIKINDIIQTLDDQANSLRQQVESSPRLSELADGIQAVVDDCAHFLKTNDDEAATSCDLHQRMIGCLTSLIQPIKDIITEAQEESPKLRDAVAVSVKGIIVKNREHLRQLQKTLRYSVAEV